MAEQDRLHADTLNQLAVAGAAAQQAEQDNRLVLEQKLAASEQAHFEKMANVQKDQARLRDRLATSNLRLSVLLAEDPASGCSVPAGTAAGGVVHGGARARLDPAHAQRNVAIADVGDQGLIALLR